MQTVKKILLCALVSIHLNVSAQDVFDAARTGDIGRLRALQLIKSDTLSCLNENGFCPLLLATYRNQTKTVQFLLKQNVNVNQGSQEGTTLVAAAYKGNVKIAKMLLKNGAKTDVQGHDGATALIFASQNGDKKMISLLLKYNADKTIKDTFGKTAMDYVKLSKDKSIVEIFDNKK